MLCALDILLSLAVGPPLQLTSRRPPYKLCFLLERGRESGKIDAFAVLPVEPGREQLVSILLAQQSQDVTVLLSLSDFGTAPAFTYQSAALLRHPEGGSPAVL